MSNRQLLRINVTYWIAFLLYTILAIVIFWPLLTHLTSTVLKPNTVTTGLIAVYGGRDAYHFMWNYWWVKSSVISAQNPLYTHLYFYPQGVSLVLQTIDFVDALIAIPLSSLLGLVAAYNITIFLSFILTGFTMFLLANYLTKSSIASFGAGLIYAYAPQHVTQALSGHPNLSSIEWLPAFLLALILSFDRKQVKYAIVAGIMLTLLTFTDLELLILGLIIATIIVFYYLFTTRFQLLPKLALLVSIMIVVWLAISSPYILAAYQGLGVVHSTPSLRNAMLNAAKPQLYLIPPPATLSYGNLFASVYSYSALGGGPSQWVIFIGYVTLALACVGAIASKYRIRFVFMLMAGLSFLFSLGPSDTKSFSIQTPYTFLYNNINVLRYFRAEARFSILLMLCLAILAAYGIEAMMKLSNGHTTKTFSRPNILGVILVSLIILEFAPTINVANIPVLDPYYTKISHDSSNFAVFELPATRATSQIYLYEQTQFLKPLINGKISQSGVNVPTYVKYQLFLCPMSQTKCPAENVIRQPFNEAQLGRVILTYYNIKYVIINRQLISKSQLRAATSLLRASLGSPVYKDKDIIVYVLQNFLSNESIAQIAQSSPLTFFGSGWTASGGGVIANNSATLIVYASQATTYTLEMRSSLTPTCVINIASSQPIQCGQLDPNTGISTYDIFLNAGQNILNLQASANFKISFVDFVA